MIELIEQLKLLNEAVFAKLVTYKPNGGTSSSKTVGIRTSYNKKFIMALKATVPMSDRVWNDLEKEWVVDHKYYGAMKNLVKDHYGVDPEETSEALSASNPLADKNQLALIISKDRKWIDLKTPYDKGFVADIKEFFPKPKWNGAGKRWKVAFSKENLSMATYLMKRYFKKAPEVLKA